jgi:hypothetical protein
MLVRRYVDFYPADKQSSYNIHLRMGKLSACDYFLWGYLKAKVYTTRPRTVDDFKIAIRKQISAIPENMAKWALGNLRASLEECVQNDGRHLSDVLLKTKWTEA